MNFMQQASALAGGGEKQAWTLATSLKSDFPFFSLFVLIREIRGQKK